MHCVWVCVSRPLQSSRRLSNWHSRRLELLRPKLLPVRPGLLLLARLWSPRLLQWPEQQLCQMQQFWWGSKRSPTIFSSIHRVKWPTLPGDVFFHTHFNVFSGWSHKERHRRRNPSGRYVDTHVVLITELLEVQWLTHFSLFPPATVGGNVIVNTVAGVPPSPFQANKRLASPVIPGTLSVSHVH